MFNTIVPSKHINKLRTLGLNTSLCNWILDFLTGRPLATLYLNTGAPKWWGLGPPPYSLFTHDCMANYDSNNIIILETLDPLQFAYRPNRSIDDAISIALHTALSHLDKRNTYVRML